MKNGLALLLLILLLACGQQNKQNSSVNKADTPQNKIIFLADTSLKANQNDIKQLIAASLVTCYKHLQNDSITFSIYPTTIADKEIIKEMRGVTGITYDKKHIALTIDPTVIYWKETLKSAVAHEYHHTFCIDTFDSAYTLLDYLVFEGKADYFAHLLYPNVITPWTSALSEKEKSTLWAKIKPKLQSKDTSFHSDVMFGYNSYPVWGGYTLGFSIVQSALKNNLNLPIKTWTYFTATKMLDMSDYKLNAH